MKTAKGLVEYAQAQLGLPYWYGTFGQIGSKELYVSKKKQYPMYYRWEGTPYNNFSYQYGKRVHDCVGLIKGYLWSDTPTSSPKYNVEQDKSADGMRKVCKETGTISSMPDIPGILVFMSGHVGVYIGDGYVIEARGHEYGVVKTALGSRPWKWWGKCPYISYSVNSGVSNDNKDSSETNSVQTSDNCVRLKPGTWNVRKFPSTNSPVTTVLKGSCTVNISKGWIYLPSYDGFISEKAIDQQ